MVEYHLPLHASILDIISALHDHKYTLDQNII